ncbi:hypothetical protein PoB_000448300 [Plakobranchus ocellatus]|uniref:MADF domain-containing protein n=1 Tax=Plakobranchus ocellatus TaxID=259542 RepID=A0AAV3Y705_9GAST|nr:hypothetical protein PoB_000448300 [Plakobranchus ocellatus]
MDVERLISAVFERPCIWDMRRNDHSNRNVTDKAWKDISKELNVEGGANNNTGREKTKNVILISHNASHVCRVKASLLRAVAVRQLC